MVEMHDGARLAVLMQRAKISDAKLADDTRSSVQAVGKWKRTGQIARDKIAPICRSVHAKSDELLGLMPISGVAEQPAAYRVAPDRDALRDAIAIVRHALDQPGVSVTAEGFADFAVAVYDMLGTGQSIEDAQRIVAGMLRAFAKNTAGE